MLCGMRLSHDCGVVFRMRVEGGQVRFCDRGGVWDPGVRPVLRVAIRIEGEKRNGPHNGPFEFNLGSGLLSHTFICSIIGDKGLNFRVRNGTGCTPLSMATKEISLIFNQTGKRKVKNKPHDLLVPVSSKRHRSYTSGLSTT